MLTAAIRDGDDMAQRIWQRVYALPGVIAFLALYVATLGSGGFFAYTGRICAQQTLDATVLDADYWGSLLNLHIQPPLMNAIYGITDQVTGHSEGALQIVMLIAAVVMVLVVPLTVHLAGAPHWLASATGLLVGILPTTVLYSLWPGSTILVSCFGMLALFGLALTRRHMVAGVLVSAIGMFGLFFVRASFVWVLALAWLAILVWIAMREAKGRTRTLSIMAVAVVGLGVLGTQAHYFTRFGLVTLSSFSGENMVNALRHGNLDPAETTRLVEQSTCYAQLLEVGPFQTAISYPDCLLLVDSPLLGHPVLDVEDKLDTTCSPNLNYGWRLSLAPVWTKLATQAIKDDPSSVWRIVAGHDGQPGSLAVFLSKGEDYYDVFAVHRAAMPQVWEPLSALSGVVPSLAWLFVIGSILGGVIGRLLGRRWPVREFWLGVVLLLMHAVPSLVGDFGENHRFRAEFDSVLVTVAVLGIWSLLARRSRRE